MKYYWNIIDKYFPEGTKRREYYLPHVDSVTKMALTICERHPELDADNELVETAAMLHDIGICRVHAPDIGCTGSAPYLQHGLLGAEIVRQEGMNEIAPFCTSHIGVGGLSKEYIRENGLPLPEQDMLPLAIEEKIVAFADKFFSKSHPTLLSTPKSISDIRRNIARYGADKVALFDEWRRLFL